MLCRALVKDKKIEKKKKNLSQSLRIGSFKKKGKPRQGLQCLIKLGGEGCFQIAHIKEVKVEVGK